MTLYFWEDRIKWGVKHVVVERWSQSFNIHDELRVTPLWVQFPSLLVVYWGVRTLSRIAITVGVPLFADDCTTR